ncbi:hypothetical protein LSAT2_015630 [Lamellibrachia satsuma]|nr:hypothetical protein LSAT2_015630 [Lamellibrachia satsuma]
MPRLRAGDQARDVARWPGARINGYRLLGPHNGRSLAARLIDLLRNTTLTAVLWLTTSNTQLRLGVWPAGRPVGHVYQQTPVSLVHPSTRDSTDTTHVTSRLLSRSRIPVHVLAETRCWPRSRRLTNEINLFCKGLRIAASVSPARVCSDLRRTIDRNVLGAILDRANRVTVVSLDKSPPSVGAPVDDGAAVETGRPLAVLGWLK